MKTKTTHELFVEHQNRIAEELGECSYDDIGVTLVGYYYIEWDRVRNSDELARWLHHLADKNWFTVLKMKWLISVVMKHNGIELHPN